MSYKPKHQDAIPALPDKYLELKKEIAKDLNPDILSKAWKEILDALEKMTDEAAKAGPEGIPQINFKDLQTLSPSQKDRIKLRTSTGRPGYYLDASDDNLYLPITCNLGYR